MIFLRASVFSNFTPDTVQFVRVPYNVTLHVSHSLHWQFIELNYGSDKDFKLSTQNAWNRLVLNTLSVCLKFDSFLWEISQHALQAVKRYTL